MPIVRRQVSARALAASAFIVAALLPASPAQAAITGPTPIQHGST